MSSRFVFTRIRLIYNDYLLLIKSIKKLDLSYLICSFEYSKSTGIHFQGYIETKDDLHLYRIKNTLKGFYVEEACGDIDQNIKYITKGDGYVFYKHSLLLTEQSFHDKIHDII